MTNADKVQINNLVKGIAELTKAVNSVNNEYHDERIFKYAIEAAEDYRANKDALSRILVENFSLFFPDSLLKLGDGISNRRLLARRGESVGIDLGCGVYAVVRLTDFDIVKSDYDYTTFLVNSLVVENIKYHTSDTDKTEYRICVKDDLVDSGRRMDISVQKRTATGWKSLYNMANATRAKNELLVRSFKKCLAARQDLLRAKANELEETQKSARELTAVYVKVSI
jgi:hypothetical protein